MNQDYDLLAEVTRDRENTAARLSRYEEGLSKTGYQWGCQMPVDTTAATIANLRKAIAAADRLIERIVSSRSG